MKAITRKILTKRILFVLALIVASLVTNAQRSERLVAKEKDTKDGGSKCFDESSRVVNIGVGLGGMRYYKYNRGLGYTYRSTPAISISYEQALAKKLGPGILGVGGYFGFAHSTLRYDDYFYLGNKYYYSHSWNYYLLAARAAYHLDALNFEKGEVYFGALAGVRFQTYKFRSNSPDPDDYKYYQLTNRGIWPAYSLFVGGRYYFTNKIGVYAELGYGVSYLTAGLSIKI